MKAIELSQSIYALVDDDVYGWLNHWNWSVTRRNKKRCYARRQMFHPTKQKQDFVYMHKIISGVNKDFYLQFRDGNSLNMQRENLCIMDYTRSEIVWDGSRQESLFKGVVWDKYYGLWKAHLKGLTIGHFVSEFDAVKAYNSKALEILEDRAELNNLESVCQKR